MKAATGELNLTLITVVALGALLALFMGPLWNSIKESITNSWDDVDDKADVDNFDTTYNYENYDFPNYVDTDLF